MTDDINNPLYHSHWQKTEIKQELIQNIQTRQYAE